MTTYFSTFISGLSEVVVNALVQELPDAKAQKVLDGLIVYDTDASKEFVAKLRFFNNSFLLLGQFDDESLEEMVAKVVKDTKYVSIVKTFVKDSLCSFRLILSLENKMVSVNKKIVEQLENKIRSVSNLRLDRSKPDLEFWFIKRRESVGFFGVRLTKHPDYADVLEKGQLRPELANLLCHIAEPKANDVFLDPFAGSGAIPLELAFCFPFKKIIAGDIDLKKVNALKKKATGAGFEVAQFDSLRMSKIANSSINKIITDPPWGIFGEKKFGKEFYRGILLGFLRVLTTDGKIIVLMGNKEGFEESLSEVPLLNLQVKYDILVSGKKASIYKLSRFL